MGQDRVPTGTVIALSYEPRLFQNSGLKTAKNPQALKLAGFMACVGNQNVLLALTTTVAVHTSV